ncbi:MAG: hypothetical protein R3345_01855 [Fulvivirga sp.]|nr:hypothetical protein [Fulvivirga sp.]
MKNLWLFILLVASGCGLDKGKHIDREKFTFKTGDDTELFFKNVRQSYYDLEENKAAKFNVFRYEDRPVASDEPIIHLAIVINYMQDEAYLLVEPNAYLSDTDPIEIKAAPKNGGESKIVVLKEMNKEAMLAFASDLYELLLKDYQFAVNINGQWEPVLDAKEERAAFRITVSDYYRLVRVY